MPESNKLPPAAYTEVEAILKNIKISDDRLTSWEKDFVRDQKERLKKFGADIFLSEKQLTVLKKIDAKLQERDDASAVDDEIEEEA